MNRIIYGVKILSCYFMLVVFAFTGKPSKDGMRDKNILFALRLANQKQGSGSLKPSINLGAGEGKS